VTRLPEAGAGLDLALRHGCAVRKRRRSSSHDVLRNAEAVSPNPQGRDFLPFATTHTKGGTTTMIAAQTPAATLPPKALVSTI
jgi:hypothetical protein